MSADAVLNQCSLADEIERLTPSQDDESGRRAEILVKENDLRVTLVTMRAGIHLAEHTAPVSISIQALKGRMDVEYEGGSATLGPGDFISLRQGVKHSVRAIEDGAFLLTLGWSTE